ncbi:hypothetical protein NLU13_2418 [Sarocladium strictum]|uniref:Uncharacterized protein n=1 Tax=Sarocladium strictum TaxID=5046 RepID=A0AA39GTJ7_SARSR|nr:hypothetical protein NLU13_2418 [Sarocladium strictum]
MAGSEVSQEMEAEATIPPHDRARFEAHVQTLLSQYRQKYISANPKSASLYRHASEVLAGGNTRSVLYYEPFPMVLASGRGCHVTSEDGREYVDLVSEYSACMLGHSHPDIARAVRATVERGINLGGASREELHLASLLARRIPSLERLRFCNSGTEANTMALTVALHYTGRRRILAFENGYHGSVIGFGKGGAVLPTTLPFDFVVARYDDAAHAEELVDESFAAIIVEPMQSVGGMVPASTAFLRALRDVADRTGAVLIFDEVVTSRLHHKGMQTLHGVYPDMTTLGKFWGGGFSFGAFGGRADIMSVLDPGRRRLLGHSGTFNNNAFSMTAGAVACGLITEEEIARANALGDRLREGVNAAGRRATTMLPPCFWATGYGSMLNVHFGGGEVVVAGQLRDAFFFFMLDRGIYVSQRGLMAINLMHAEEHVGEVLEAVEGFVDALNQVWEETE